MKKLFIITLSLLTLFSCSNGGESKPVDEVIAEAPNSPVTPKPEEEVDAPEEPINLPVPTISASSTTLGIYVGESSTITLTKANVDSCEGLNLPSFVTIDSETCLITLNPVSFSSGNINFGVIGKNTSTSTIISTETLNFSLTLIVRPPSLTASVNLAQLEVNMAMTSIAVESSSPLVECFSTTVVPGLGLNLISGKCIISGTPSTPGSYNYEVRARLDGSVFSDTISIPLNVYIQPVISSTTTSFSGKVGDSVNANFNINSGVTIQSCNVTPSLPTGLSLTRYSDHCALSGSITTKTSDTGSSYSISTISSSGQTSNSLSFRLTAYDTFCKGSEGSYSQETTNNGVSASTPIIICTAQGLIDYASDSANNGKYYRLQKNININNSTESVVPTFNGHLNGAGYSVTYNAHGSSCNGFIGTMTGGSIRNVYVKNVTINDGTLDTGFVGCVKAPASTVTFNDILMTNNSLNNLNNASYTGFLIGLIGPNTTVNVNNMYVSLDNLEAGDPTNFSLIYASGAGSATLNTSSAYFTNMNSIFGFDSFGMTEVSHTLMMSNPMTTLLGFSSSWDLMANNYPKLVLRQDRIYVDKIIQY
jgi:hypothetical protein